MPRTPIRSSSALYNDSTDISFAFARYFTDGKYPQFKFKTLTAEEKQAQFDTYISGVNSKALTKTREDENFQRKRLGVPLLPEDHPVAGEVTPQPPLRLVTGRKR